MTQEFLDIVDDNDEIIGKESREKVHNEGLLHREIHVLFITPNKEIIFQHRAKDKDTYPDLLDATVGGHVDSGMNYKDTVTKEMFEETGLKISFKDLIFLKKVKDKTKDLITGKINYSFKNEYAFIFKGNLSDLVIEKGKSIGFEPWSINKIFNLNEEDKKKFIPKIIEPDFFDLYKQIEKLV